MNMSDVTKIMSRVRKAIRDFDPSYRLKANGHICAKEWREIMPPPLDFIWGKGYTWALDRINEEIKINALRASAKDTVKIDADSRHIDDDALKYCLNDIAINVDVEGGKRRAKEIMDALKGGYGHAVD
jgi:hypothetical protein